MSPEYYLHALMAFAVILGVLYIASVLAKSFHRTKFKGDIRVEDRISLDVGVSLLVVKIKDQKYLFSVGGKDVKLVKELSDD